MPLFDPVYPWSALTGDHDVGRFFVLVALFGGGRFCGAVAPKRLPLVPDPVRSDTVTWQARPPRPHGPSVKVWATPEIGRCMHRLRYIATSQGPD